MNLIQVLSSDVSNKIAAGEVVERPASVVKELIENALDAGATSLTVEIKHGGISYIRVTDNGSGMGREDAKTAFLRHATSKIKQAEDLQHIATLGFRGEALASIAAVANVELLTCTREGEGTYVELHGGRVVTEQAAGCPVGTTIVVRNLFSTTPARMKFLKRDATEGGYVSDIVQRLVLSRPDISVRFLSDGAEKLFSPGDGNLKTCIYSVYGGDHARLALPVKRMDGGIVVTGYIGDQQLARGNRAFQSFFVNGRYVKSRSLTFAVEHAFQNNMMAGKFPFFVLHITMPGDELDINVHPTKQQVKFADEQKVTSALHWAVKDALSQHADVVREQLSQARQAEQGMFADAPTIGQPQANAVQDHSFFAQQQPQAAPSFGLSKNPYHVPTQMGKPEFDQQTLPLSLEEPSAAPFLVTKQQQQEQPQTGYRVIGQLFDTYIIIELGKQIVLIDQHAAHERLLYEKLVQMHRQTGNVSQVLLEPVVVTLSPLERSKLEEKQDLIEQMGFVMEDFGTDSLLVRQAPAGLGGEGVKEALLELLQRQQGTLSERDYEALHMVACKAAVKGNNPLKPQEIEALMNELLNTGGINTCPHGRPIMLSITRYELEKMFKRV